MAQALWYCLLRRCSSIVQKGLQLLSAMTSWYEQVHQPILPMASVLTGHIRKHFLSMRFSDSHFEYLPRAFSSFSGVLLHFVEPSWDCSSCLEPLRYSTYYEGYPGELDSAYLHFYMASSGVVIDSMPQFYQCSCTRYWTWSNISPKTTLYFLFV